MTTARIAHDSMPAALGGSPAFPEGLPLTVLRIPDRPALLRQLDEVLESGRLTNGPRVAALEERAAELLETDHVVAVSTCTAGLMLVLQALGVHGRPVVMPSFTFSATAHAAHWAGGTPVFAEIEPDGLTLDPAHAAERLTATGASAVMATHVYGTPCRVEQLQQHADAAGVPLVYDAAHALGGRRRGRPIGSFGSAEVFSMSPTKVAVAGEGGLVATRDAALAERIRLARDYGNPGDYDCVVPGLNARMSELHATLGAHSLNGLAERVAHRSELATEFVKAVAGVPGLRLPQVADADTSTFKDLTLVLDAGSFGLSAPALAEALRAEGVDSRRYFYPPVHRQRAYAELLEHQVPLPVTEELSAAVLTVPLWSQMEAATVRRIADAVVRIHRHAARIAAAG